MRKPCGTCGGSGKVYQTQFDPKQKRSVSKLVTCPGCGGSGQR